MSNTTPEQLRSPASTTSYRQPRLEIAALLEERRKALAEGRSEREFCEEVDFPRATLRDEVKRVEGMGVAPEVAAFFTSPQGHLFLMRIVLAAHFVMTQAGCCGVALVCAFLDLACLGPFVGTSYGAQYELNVRLQKETARFGPQEQKRLGKTMPRRMIWLCEDETFFEEMVLVAIDAISNYVLVERVAEQRDAATWNEAVNKQLEGLAVDVVGVTADGAKGIAAQVRQSFGMAVTPDNFHVSHDVGKGATAALASRVRAVEEQLERVRQLGDDDKAVAEDLARAKDHQQRMAAAIQGLGEACRPYDERTGEIRRGNQVEADLREMLDEAESVATAAQLSEASCKGIGKARRVIGAMATSVEGYHQRVDMSLQAQQLPEDILSLMRNHVLPALYLEHIAEQASDGETKRRLHKRAGELSLPLRTKDGPMMQLGEPAVADLLRLGSVLVTLYVRASSCAEGRNGNLELHHHSGRGLSATKLAALTVMHNFWIRRSDGTTAAERFFGQQPLDLFEWLLDVMPDLPRPAQRRPRIERSLLN